MKPSRENLPQVDRLAPSMATVWPGALPVGVVIMTLAVLAVFRNTFSVPFLFDDTQSIVANETIRQIWPPWAALQPPQGSGVTVEGRPLLNLSFAFNHAISGSAVWSYHALNLAIHLAAALALFGLLRRTFRQPAVAQAWPSIRGPGPWLALLTAVLWAVHPLQTGAVTYVSQRAESLMGLFYLLTLYCFVRGATADPRKSRVWHAGAMACCALGMATKEVMVTAPLVVLLYDRTFVAGSFAAAWRQRRWVYAGLAGTWLVLGFLLLDSHGRGGTAGFGSGISWWDYAVIQIPAVAHYLWLCLWPAPLVFDYGTIQAFHPGPVWPAGLVVFGLIAATLWALRHRPVPGFLGAAFFLILAPSSSFVPVATEVMAEHRLYLPSILVVVAIAMGVHRWLPRWGTPICLGAGLVLGTLTWRRNADYHSGLSLWGDTVEKNPLNPRAQNNLGLELEETPGRSGEALAHFATAVRLMPEYAEARNNLGNALLRQGQPVEAIRELEQALAIRPAYSDAESNLGNALMQAGRTREARPHYEQALALDPRNAEAQNNLGNVLQQDGQTAAAISGFEAALHLDPDYAAAHLNLGNALAATGRLDEALPEYQAALRLNPAFPEAHYGLGLALGRAGQWPAAIDHYRQALALRPDYPSASNNLGNALLRSGQVRAAVETFEAALRLDPAQATMHYNLANALLRVPDLPAAIAHCREALRLQPDFPQARDLLARLPP